MIARLTGTLAETAADSAVIDVAASASGPGSGAHARRARAGRRRGDAADRTSGARGRDDLFAFGSAGERESFRALTSVQGVGGRVALAILSVLDPAELAPPWPKATRR